ncbi:MAG: ThuA domain-containing protein [Verrucomicrobiota bacterium]
MENRYQVTCYRAFGKDKGDSLPGLEALEKSDLMVVFTRRITLPPTQLALVRKHLAAGRAVIGIRTASHGFQNYPEFDKEVLGGGYKGHHADDSAEVQISPGRANYPLLAGVKPFPTRKLYKNAAVADDVIVLLEASTPVYREPVAWVRQHNGSRMFYTSLGTREDFAQESFRQLLVNAIFWTTQRDEAANPSDPESAQKIP